MTTGIITVYYTYNDEPKTGLTPEVTVSSIRKSDDQIVKVVDAQAMAPVSATDHPGVYYYSYANFDTDLYVYIVNCTSQDSANVDVDSIPGDVSFLESSIQASVNAIPTNPLLTNDARLNNLDAAISSRATQTSVNDIPTASENSAATWGAVSRVVTGIPKEAEIDAIKAKTDNLPADPASETNVDQVVTDVWSENLSTYVVDQAGKKLHTLQGAPSANIADYRADVSALALEASAQAIKNKTDNLPADPASETNVDALLSEIWSEDLSGYGAGTAGNKVHNFIASPSANLDDYKADISALALEASLQLIKAKTDNLPVDPASGTAVAAVSLDVWLEDLSGYGVGTAGNKVHNLQNPPSQTLDDYKADIAALALEATAQAIKAKTDNLPADPASETNVDNVYDDVWSTDPAGYGADTAGLALATAAAGADPQAVAVEVWSEPLANYNGAGIAGERLKVAASANDPDVVAERVWDRQTGLHPDTGSFGRHVRDLVSAPSANLDDYKADLTQLLADVASLDTILTVTGANINSATITEIASQTLRMGASATEDSADFYSLTDLILTVLKSELIETSPTTGQHNVKKTSGGNFRQDTVMLDGDAKPIVSTV